MFILIVVYFKDLNWDNFVKTEKQIYNEKENARMSYIHFLVFLS